MTETAQTSVPVNDLDLFANNYIPEYGEEGKHRRHGRLAIYNEKRYMVDLEAIGQVSNPGASFVGMSDDNDFMPTIDEFLAPNEYYVGHTRSRILTVDNW